MKSDPSLLQNEINHFYLLSPDPMCIASYDGYFKSVNPAFVNMLGYTEKELLTVPYLTFVHPEDAPKTEVEAEGLKKGHSSLSFENRYYCKDGSIKWLSWKCSMTKEHIFGVARDVTAVKETEQELRQTQQQLQTVLENAPIALTLVSTEGSVEFSIGKAVERAGRKQNEIRGQNLFITQKESPAIINAFKQAIAGERSFVRNSYKDLEFDLCFQPIFNNLKNVEKVLCVALDVTEQRRTEEEQYYRQIANSIPQIAWILNTDGKVSFYNLRWKQYSQNPDYRTLTEDFLNLVHPDDQQRWVKTLNSALSTGIQSEIEFRLLDHSGGYHWHLCQLAPVKNLNDEIIKWVVTATNIDAKKTEEETSRRMAAIMESSEDAIIGKDTKGIITTWNDAAQRMFGYSSEEIIGKSVMVLFPPERQHEEHEILGNVLQGRRVSTFETQRRRKDGSNFYVSISVSPIKDSNNKVIGIAKIVRDVTKERKTKTELVASEVRERTALEASHIKSEFLANMSHEIRTPLNGIVGASSLLNYTHLDTEQKNLVDTITQSADHLLNLVNDILDLAKIEANKLELDITMFKLGDLTNNIVRTFKIASEIKKIDFKVNVNVPENIYFSGDIVRVRQILFNLLQNALKFTDSGSIQLDILTVDPEPNKINLKFIVTDTGVGIGEPDVAGIFHPFVQGDNSITKKHGGAGLGLSICYQLVTLMGGKIEVESQLGQGSKFWFEYPTTTNFQPQITKQKVVSRGALERKQYKILLAEDSPINQKVIMRTLERLGHQMTLVVNGQEAVNVASSQSFDFIFMDCHMPVMDGFTATENIRGLGVQTPIIALTANALKGTKQKCLEAGMNAYVTKPMTLDSLNSAIEEVIGIDKKTTQDTNTTKNLNPTILNISALESLKVLNKPGQPDLATDLVQNFLLDAPKKITLIKKLLKEKSLNEIYKVAHSLKSSAAVLGLETLSAIAEKLEESAHQNQAKPCRQIVPELDQVYKLSKAEIQKFMNAS